MTDQELKELQLKQEIDTRFKAIAAKVEELAARIETLESFTPQLARVDTLETIAARVGALEKQLAAKK